MAQNILELIEERFGLSVETREDPEISSIGTSADILLRRDGRRIAFVVINLGEDAVFIRPERTASSSSGIRLAPNGGNVSMVFDEDFTLPAQQWSIVSEGASTAIYSIEVLIGGNP